MLLTQIVVLMSNAYTVTRLKIDFNFNMMLGYHPKWL